MLPFPPVKKFNTEELLHKQCHFLCLSNCVFLFFQCFTFCPMLTFPLDRSIANSSCSILLICHLINKIKAPRHVTALLSIMHTGHFSLLFFFQSASNLNPFAPLFSWDTALLSEKTRNFTRSTLM